MAGRPSPRATPQTEESEDSPSSKGGTGYPRIILTFDGKGGYELLESALSLGEPVADFVQLILTMKISPAPPLLSLRVANVPSDSNGLPVERAIFSFEK